MNPGSFQNNIIYKLLAYESYKQGLALNNSQVLICHKTNKTCNVFTNLFT